MNDIRPDVILANTANITFNTPACLLCQSTVSERQQMLDGHTNRKVLDPSWLSPWPMFRSMTGWERRQMPGAEKTTHEWLRACFIFEMIICWQEWVSVAGMGCQVAWWWHHPRLFFLILHLYSATSKLVLRRWAFETMPFFLRKPMKVCHL